jgi:lysophospholipase L1-like esterase
MARRIATTRQTPQARACAIGAALLSTLIVCTAARAQSAGPTPPVASPANAISPLSKTCQAGSKALAPEESPLPNVAAALAQRKTLRILSFGAAPGRIGSRGDDYMDLIEAMLQGALKGTDVIMINRGVSGELAADAAFRMKTEVALEEPDLVLWQVGTNDALAYVPVEAFTTAVKEQIDWLKAHKVDLVLVGLQFAPPMLRDAHYVDIRQALRQVAARENVIVIRFYEAMQILDRMENAGGPVADQFERSEAGYNCLAQYVARAITLGVFAKSVPKRPAAK